MSEENDERKVVIRRNLPGTPAAQLFSWEPLEESYDQMESAFSTQEYLETLIRKDPSDLDAICKLPTGCEPNVWIAEHLRNVLSTLNQLVVALEDHCTAQTCPLMIATKSWEFLCAAHPKQPRACSAIDYTLHQLAFFTAALNNPDDFPSRSRITPKAAKMFSNIARRVYRLFAHPFYHHRSIFDELESQTHLCRRFMNFCLTFGLMTTREFTPAIDLDSAASS